MDCIHVKCTNDLCGLNLVVREEQRGQIVQCAGCGEMLLVPPAEPQLELTANLKQLSLKNFRKVG